ncbi:MAG TPA: porin [Aquabacterium sp.]|uniref:porin n=1 Tax=Aquabacterium sp. TaxID=1872578 RepID=UPI002E35FBD6|nr:porin [Aquabacterium sp.]HEX5372501.1 porin [Aquabacterium sp.]
MMKKTLIAAAALMAGVAAQAQVNVYGTVDMSFGSFEEFNTTTGETDSIAKVESGVHTGSFIGFKGQEDLGGGLKAFFVLESDIGADIGASSDNGFWARTSELGLAGDFGTVKLGNSRSLGFLANAAYNPFPVTGLMNTSQITNAYGNYANAITYTSPNLSGFTVAAQAGMSEQDGVDNSIGLALNYAAGPLAVGFNYSTQEGALAGFFANETALGATLATLVTLPTANVDYDRWGLGASYDFGAAKLFGQFGQNKYKGDGGSFKTKAFQLGTAIPVSAQGTVLASFAQTKLDDTDLKLRDLSVVYDHALSKRTSAYAGLKSLRISADGGSETLNNVAVGIKHAF